MRCTQTTLHQPTELNAFSACCELCIIFALSRFWTTDFLHDVDINLKKKADGSRRYRRITREGLVNPRANFVADIEKEMDVPVCDIDSDDVTTSEDEENQRNEEAS